jgi:CPA2 family monovalent cation:H+ antiporter-2
MALRQHGQRGAGETPHTAMLADFLSVAAIVLGTALAVGWACRWLGAPTIVGYLITGVLLSPSAIGPSVFAHARPETITSFGDIGLVLLLFTIGLELNPGRLFKMGGRLIFATLLQIVSTATVAVMVLELTTGLSLTAEIIIGCGVALSSTAIVLKVLNDRGEVHSTVGSISTGVLLLQDVAVILLMLLVPVIAPAGAGADITGKLVATAVGIGQIVVIAAVARVLLPRIVRGVTEYGGHEMTALLAILVASGGAWVAERAGWPLEVGACIAGLLLAEADVRHQLIADITPFRDIFNALFFISLGMQVDLAVAWGHGGMLGGAILLTIAGKVLLGGGAIMVAGWPLRLAFQLALGLCTVSEFAYVLVREAEHYHLLPAAALGFMIPYAVGTMLVGSALVPIAAPIARRLMHFMQPNHKHGANHGENNHHADLSGHVMIVGYGLGGEHLARVLAATRIPCIVVEMDRGRVRRARHSSVEVIYGDAARMHILHSAGLAQARALVVAIGDVPATRHVVAQARAARPDLYILARTNYVSEIDTLKSCGASLVIPAEFEVSIEIFSQVLREFRVPDNILRAQIAATRAGGYSVLRGIPYDRNAHLKDLLEVFATTSTESYYVHDDCRVAGRTIAETCLRKATGASIIAVVRQGQPHVNPMPDFVILTGDVLILVGSHPQLDAAHALLDPTPPPPDAALV